MENTGARSTEEKETIRRCLARQSLLALGVFSLYSGLSTWLITRGLVRVDSNNILSPAQLLPIFLTIFLPLGLVNLLSCLQIILLPASSSTRRDIQHSHWSSSYIAALSLVESSRVLKYLHALKGRPQ